VGELAPLVTAGGGLGVLAFVIIYLLTNNRADRGQAEERIDAAERRADAAEERRRAAESREEQAHVARRAAEDRADKAVREVADLTKQVEALRKSVEEHVT
jgi:hypothetical protein